jgi:Protein of unknown function (DUF2914)
MKSFVIAVVVLACSFVIPGAAVSIAQENAGFEVGRFVICENVADREPVGVTTTFPVGTEKVYVYLEAKDVKADTTVEFVWFNEGAELARVPLKLGAGARWRTYASKTLFGMTGNWKVELQAEGGKVLATTEFKVE